MDNQSTVCFSRVNMMQGRPVLGLEMWIWGLGTPMDDNQERKLENLGSA